MACQDFRLPLALTKLLGGKVPAAQSLVYAFDENPSNRALQDIGLDGLTIPIERNIYTNTSLTLA